MRSLLAPVALALLGLAHTASAEVTNADPGGFYLASETTIAADRGTVWQAAVARIGEWWDDDHTVSGDAANMRIEAVPLGCFCESLGGHAGVVHQIVTFVNPTVMIRLTGGLGPLGLMGVDGNMLWEFFDDDQGARVRFSYAVGGYHPDGLDSVAPAVDFVIGEALLRLKAYVETGNADDPDAG